MIKEKQNFSWHNREMNDKIEAEFFLTFPWDKLLKKKIRISPTLVQEGVSTLLEVHIERALTNDKLKHTSVVFNIVQIYYFCLVIGNETYFISLLHDECSQMWGTFVFTG
jgi:hypothetical protein